MAVLQINPAVREEIVTVGNGGKVQLDEGAFAENFVEFNHLTCYNDILYDRTGKAISSAECKHDIYEVLRGFPVITQEKKGVIDCERKCGSKADSTEKV